MKSIRALMNRIVDYAGLFPPAKLDMASTVRNYARYLQSDDSWMLGRLIVPVARLEEFEEHAAPYLARKQGEAEAWQISALTAPAGTVELEPDLKKIQLFNKRYKTARIHVIELKADSSAAIDRALDQMPNDLFPFFELPIERDPRGLIAALAEGECGAKARTGGITADAYPASGYLARFIVACAAADVPFKATAGLHHPLRRFSDAMRTHEFGFLNVFVAGCLAREEQMTVRELVPLLEDESLDEFLVNEKGLSWREHRLDTAAIERIREEFAVSFGSCSFEEPLEDLRQMKLI